MISAVWGLIKFVLEVLLLIAFLYSFTTHFMLWLEKRYKQLANEPDADIPWRYVVKNFFLEACYQFILMILYPFSKWVEQKSNLKAFASQFSQPKTPSILLIHGYCHNRNDWLWFRRQLQSIEGMGPVFTMNLQPTDTLAASSAKVEKKINKIHTVTGQDQIILIGHSTGGLVASYYTEHLAHSNVNAVICLGAPFSGTKTAVFGMLENAKELAPNSPIVTKLKESVQQSRVPYYLVASKLDNVILPWHSACPHQLQKSENTLILENVGHLGLLLSPPIVTKVVEWVFGDSEFHS